MKNGAAVPCNSRSWPSQINETLDDYKKIICGIALLATASARNDAIP
jgi:hypothetical protein